VALLWDESFIWGVVTRRALNEVGLPFRLVRASDVREGRLSGYRALLVPGGWASNKIKALGESGKTRIRQFVADGGTYIGLCGGAGLATRQGLSLVDVERVPTDRRVPSFNGRIRIALIDSPLWEGVTDPVFYAWWPSQFRVGKEISILARYDEALFDAFSSDLNVGDVQAAQGWDDLESYYGINLDPARMRGEPAVLSGRFGQGRVLLSLLHFDMPGDQNGLAVLKNLWRLWGGEEDSPEGRECGKAFAETPLSSLATIRPSLQSLIRDIQEAVDGLIDFGIRNFLWFWRNSFMLQWKRGVRGLEYCTLKVLADEIAKAITWGSRQTAKSDSLSPGDADRVDAPVEERLILVREALLPFVRDARLLLMLERQAMLRERLTFDASSEPRIIALRKSLFSTSKSYGGRFKGLIDSMDELLYTLYAS
jgi:putative intracellular protease/amidase